MQEQAAAIERDAGNDRASAETFALDAALREGLIVQGVPPSQSRETEPDGPSPARNRARQPRGIQSGQGPASEFPKTLARETSKPETPDYSTEVRDRAVRQGAARGGEDTPAAWREPARPETRSPPAIQSANSSRSQTAPPAVHIGTLDIRIEAPNQRATSPTRQPVRFRGSGMLSRLYLRRE
jgi:hypothetical protein